MIHLTHTTAKNPVITQALTAHHAQTPTTSDARKAVSMFVLLLTLFVIFTPTVMMEKMKTIVSIITRGKVNPKRGNI